MVCQGLVFLGKNVRVHARPGYGRVVLGRFLHLGDGCRIYSHEGTVRIGAKSVLGREVTITSYLDIDIGDSCLLADWTYVTDFDHELTDISRPIKDQGLAKTPVRISSDCWLGVRTTVLRGSRIGAGTVVGAHSVVRGSLPDLAVAVGVPARVVKDRRALHEAEQDRREYLAGLARGNAEQAAQAASRSSESERPE